MKNLTVAAKLENLDTVLDFIGQELVSAGCPEQVRTQVAVAAEEIYVNIANYAYGPEAGKATVSCEAGTNPARILIRFTDGGRPYNPLSRPDPDITLPAKDRQIGGLGVFMVKNYMDEVTYDYRGGKNTLTMKKRWNA